MTQYERNNKSKYEDDEMSRVSAMRFAIACAFVLCHLMRSDESRAELQRFNKVPSFMTDPQIIIPNPYQMSGKRRELN